MKNILVEQMQTLTKLSQEEILAIEESFLITTLKKGEFLLKEGEVAKDSFSIIEGCIRKYHIKDGEEIIVDFFIEGDTVADFNSLANKVPSNYYFSCCERTTVVVFNAQKEAELYMKIPRFETICRVEFEKMMGEKMDEKESFLGKTPEEKYLSVLQERPGLINRVPHYQLASYLGIRPETLSRIRKRISKKSSIS